MGVYVSIKFGCGMGLGYRKSGDGLEKKVEEWWKKKGKEIYGGIGEFGGLVVKGNCEGEGGGGD